MCIRDSRKNKKENEKIQKEEVAKEEAQKREDIRKNLEDKKIKAAIRQRRNICANQDKRW